MYEYTDKVICTMNRRFLVLFNRLKERLAKLDEISVLLKAVDDTYAELDSLTRAMLLKSAKKAYIAAGGDEDIIDEMWIIDFLNEYSPITKYAYVPEVERKRARLFEALAATGNSPKEIKTALHLWSRMAGEYAVEVTDAAALQAYRDMGIRRVQWFTEIDERRCSVCAERHGLIYLISRVPPKPHLNCRCVLKPIQ